MKLTALAACVLVASATGQWWNGCPECAEECFSSFWSSSSNWPAPTSYCGASQGPSVHSCISSKCSATPTAVASYSSLSSSLCSNWAACSSAGSTGVYTVTAPAFTGVWGPGRYGPHGHHWGDHDGDDNDDDHGWAWDHDGDGHNDDWDDWTKTWSGGVYTVTGCEWNGNPWAGGPGGCGPGGAAGSPWGPWGKGWTWTTKTETITRVATTTDAAGKTALTTSVGLATVAQAVSGSVTSTSLVTGANAQETGAASGNGNGNDANPTAQQGAAGRNEAVGVKVTAVLLGGVVAIAGML